MLHLSRPQLDEAAIAAVAHVLRSGNLVHGEQGQAFEQELQAWLGCKNAVLVSSGTAALHLALLALDIGSGDAVLVPDFTFPATCNVVMLVGARPVLVDVDPRTYCMTPATLAAAVDGWRGPERLRAVIPVHEFGNPVDMAGVRALAQRNSLAIVEDAACAIGAQVDGVQLGTIGDIGCFSMHPRKTLTTGEGGILVTNDNSVAQRLRRLRSHGLERGPTGLQVYEPGLNCRLTDFQSALGRAQLPHLRGWITARRKLAALYRSALQALVLDGRLELPADHPGHSWQTFMVVLSDDVARDRVIARMAEAGIEAKLGAHCLSAQSPFATFAPPCGGVARRLFHQGLALPFCEQYTSADVERVVSALTVSLERRDD